MTKARCIEVFFHTQKNQIVVIELSRRKEGLYSLVKACISLIKSIRIKKLGKMCCLTAFPHERERDFNSTFYI